MDQPTFTGLTGITPSTAQSAVFDTIADMAGQLIEEALGWPLDPSDLDDQYIETGQLPEDWAFDFDWEDFDDADLLPPDTIQGSTRVFRWHEFDEYLSIDPAITIYAVKLIKDDITVHTFNPKHYRVQWTNNRTSDGPFARYIQLDRNWWLRKWIPFLWYPLPEMMYPYEHHFVQLAVDADWGFEDLPTTIQRVWAEQIAYEFDLKRDIKSESMLGHSYSKDARIAPVDRYAATLTRFAGPNSSIIKAPFLT